MAIRYDLGEEAFADTFDGATGLWQKVRTVVGKVTVRWRWLGSLLWDCSANPINQMGPIRGDITL